MLFSKIFELMITKGIKAKRPSWSGYWEWDEVDNTIMMHYKTGSSTYVASIKQMPNVKGTIEDILAKDWVIADETNTPILGGKRSLSYWGAIEMLYKHNKTIFRVNPKTNMAHYVCFKEGTTGKPYTYTNIDCGIDGPWVPTEEDVLSDEWDILD